MSIVSDNLDIQVETILPTALNNHFEFQFGGDKLKNDGEGCIVFTQNEAMVACTFSAISHPEEASKVINLFIKSVLKTLGGM